MSGDFCNFQFNINESVFELMICLEVNKPFANSHVFITLLGPSYAVSTFYFKTLQNIFPSINDIRKDHNSSNETGYVLINSDLYKLA